MIRVMCAILEQHGRVLITQRSNAMPEPLLWEFPGGKLEAGETEEQCLQREIREELGIAVQPLERLTPVVHQTAARSIELVPFICAYEGGLVQLAEHRAYRWAEKQDLRQYDWCPADMPIVEEYLGLKGLE